MKLINENINYKNLSTFYIIDTSLWNRKFKDIYFFVNKNSLERIKIYC